jgi:hypothetical protein
MVAQNRPQDKPESADDKKGHLFYKYGEIFSRTIWKYPELGEIIMCWPAIEPEKKAAIFKLLREQ